MSQSDSPKRPDGRKLLNFTLAGVIAPVGVLTFIIVLGAVLGGRWLDAQLGTHPWFTIGLVLVSIPISLVVMLAVARLAISKFKANLDQPENRPSEGTGIGKYT